MRRAASPVKDDLYELGKQKVVEFCDLNVLPRPYFQVRDLKGRDTGFCQRRLGKTLIVVDVAVTALPMAKPVCMARSYPGSKVDRTAMGVVAHECGHHVEFELIHQRRFPVKTWYAIWEETKRNDVTSYGKSKAIEGFAETMRVFILNPSLVLEAQPLRWKFITEQLKLCSAQLQHWTKILPTAYHQDIRSWIAKT